MRTRHLVGGLAALAAATAASGVQTSPVHADSCGGDGAPPCPVVESVTPRGWEAGGGRVTVTVTGQSLASVTEVSLQPIGRDVPVVSATDTSVVVTAPAGLDVGGYTLRLVFGGLGGVRADSPAVYITSAQAVAPPVTSFAPNPSLVSPAPAATAAPAPAITVPSSSHGFAFFVGGLLIGGIACLVIAARLGILPRDRRRAAAGPGAAEKNGALEHVWSPPDNAAFRAAPAQPAATATAAASPAADPQPPAAGGPGWSVRPQTPRFPR